jgi:chromosome segregation ATPase
MGKKTGLISRKSRIQQLQSELEALNLTIHRDEELLEESESKNEHLAGLCKELRTSIYEANTERVDAESRLKVLDDNICRLKEEQPVIADEIGLLETEIQESVQKEHASRQKLEDLEQINRQRNEHIEQLQQRYDQQRQAQQTRHGELTELNKPNGVFWLPNRGYPNSIWIKNNPRNTASNCIIKPHNYMHDRGANSSDRTFIEPTAG